MEISKLRHGKKLPMDANYKLKRDDKTPKRLDFYRLPKWFYSHWSKLNTRSSIFVSLIRSDVNICWKVSHHEIKCYRYCNLFLSSNRLLAVIYFYPLISMKLFEMYLLISIKCFYRNKWLQLDCQNYNNYPKSKLIASGFYLFSTNYQLI